jgi:hypothetical protein
LSQKTLQKAIEIQRKLAKQRAEGSRAISSDTRTPKNTKVQGLQSFETIAHLSKREEEGTDLNETTERKVKEQ